MTDPQQLHQDLQFVRAAVARHERRGRGPLYINFIWAVYVLVGYTLLDINAGFAGIFFMVGGIVGGILSSVLAKRQARREGEYDREGNSRALMHFCAGIVLAIVGTFSLALVIPELRGSRGSQVLVVMIGVIYFLAGVHFERYFLWLGPILVAGGALVGFIPHYPWTVLGAVIAFGLIVPTFFPARRDGAGEPSSPSNAGPAVAG